MNDDWSQPNPVPESITIFTGGLLSKWGFGDGDVLDDYLWDLGFGMVYKQESGRLPGDAWGFDHRVLIRVVEAYVVPAVRQHHDIDVYQVHTLHNPIRTRTLDGAEVDEMSGEPRDLTPTSVEVPSSAVVAIAREEQKRYAED